MARKLPPTPARPELLALLANVLARPEDAPRLVLADWLEEHGSPEEVARAELIRLQCAASPGAPSERETQLLQQYRSAWLAPYRGLEPHREDVQRGLVRLGVNATKRALRALAKLKGVLLGGFVGSST
jgi:uncharacterized protein (TIGR02996 family)